MSPIGAFTDRAHPPTDNEVRATLGRALTGWERLVAFAEATYGARSEWAFLGREYGWMRRFRRSGRTLLSMFPAADAMTALVVVPGPDVGRAAELGLSPAVHDALRGAREYAEGRWVYAPVSDDADAESIERLVALRTPPPAAHRQQGRSRAVP